MNSSYDDFIKHHNIKNLDSTKDITHTKIGSKEMNIFAGSFHISKDDHTFGSSVKTICLK